MKVIELENRTAVEVFEELKARLEGMGYLPDEYFLMRPDWQNGREIPKGADIFCATDYGGSEGVYLDVYLKWDEGGAPITKSFITGKTLGENGSDLDRMFLISSAITKAFHGDHGTYARCVRLGDQPEPEDMILHLNPSEQRVFINALVERRERLVEDTVQTEQLLRRMTGSITAYMDEVGQRPLRLSDFDKAMLAVRDGDLQRFQEHYLMAMDQADELLIATASRPGTAGRKMTLNLLTDAEGISGEAYLAACKGAVDTGDMERVTALLDRAGLHLAEPEPSLYGETALHAYTNGRRNIAEELIHNGTAEQFAGAPAMLLYSAAMNRDTRTALALSDRGAPAEPYAWNILHTLFAQYEGWAAEHLIRNGMQIDGGNDRALYACIEHDQLECAKLLLDRGMDYERYQETAKAHSWNGGSEETNAQELHRKAHEITAKRKGGDGIPTPPLLAVFPFSADSRRNAYG